MNTDLIIKVLSGKATSGEKEQLKNWLEESDNNKKEYDNISLLWNKMDGIYDKTEFDLKKAKQSIHSKLLSRQQQNQRQVRIYKYAAAAIFILLIGAGFIFYYTVNQRQSEKIYYSDNSVKEIVLPDGSHSWLNMHSSLSLASDFSQKHREVALKGEAYFEVKHDDNSPFKVNTGETVTEVLGTSFNIRQDSIFDNVSIIVNTGKVAFYKSSDTKNKVILLPGNYASFLSKEDLIKAGNNDDQNFLSWKTKVLKFYNTPIDQVCNELTRYFDKRVISSVNVKDLKLTGTFNNDSLDEIVSTIGLTLDVKVSKINNEYCIGN
jgi:transmembrane sensor